MKVRLSTLRPIVRFSVLMGCLVYVTEDTFCAGCKHDS